VAEWAAAPRAPGPAAKLAAWMVQRSGAARACVTRVIDKGCGTVSHRKLCSIHDLGAEHGALFQQQQSPTNALRDRTACPPVAAKEMVANAMPGQPTRSLTL
jgi:hypothetical protein